MNLFKKGIFLAAMAFMTISFVSLPAQAETITLDQAKARASANSRTLAQYQLNTQKAVYQTYKLQQQQSDSGNVLENMFNRYQTIQQQITALEKEGGDNSEAISQLQLQLDELNKSIDDKTDSVTSVNSSVKSSQDNEDDSEISEANYAKKLDYEVEQLYISILQQISSQQTASLQQEIAEIELQMAKTQLQLGTGTQSDIYEKTSKLSDQEKASAVIQQNIRAAKGTLNDILGRDYNADLELTDFVWTFSLDVPEFDTLLNQASTHYQALRNAKKAIEDAESDMEDSADYYNQLLLSLEIQEKELALDDKKFQLSQSVDSLLYEISAQQQTYQAAQLNCQQKQQQYTWNEKRYELGQISKLSLLNSELDYIMAKNQQTAENYALFLAEHQLQLAQKGIL